APVARMTLQETVSGPGRTEALRQVRVRAPFTGTLVALRVADGDGVARGEEIAALVSRNSAAALAGARAMLDAASTAADSGDAHLPAASGENLSAPVRIDVAALPGPVALGLFGTARITVGKRTGALVVPAAAVLRDDVYGTSRVAVVLPDGTARWVQVTTGIREGDAVEITAP